VRKRVVPEQVVSTLHGVAERAFRRRSSSALPPGARVHISKGMRRWRRSELKLSKEEAKAWDTASAKIAAKAGQHAGDAVDEQLMFSYVGQEDQEWHQESRPSLGWCLAMRDETMATEFLARARLAMGRHLGGWRRALPARPRARVAGGIARCGSQERGHDSGRRRGVLLHARDP